MRLDRARQHFKDLQKQTDRFVRDEPETKGGVDVKLDADQGECIGTAAVPVEFPEVLGGIAGEILYHLRSALDNLAWQLVIANDKTPGSRTEFPVFTDEPEFDRCAPRRMRGMSGTARTVIKDLQPFIEAPEHPEHTTLALIHNLNRIDKHRLPHMTCLWLCHLNAVMTVPAPVEGVYSAPIGPLEHGAKLFHFRWDAERAKAVPNGEMYVDIDVSSDIAIQNPEMTFRFVTGEAAEGLPLRPFFNAAFDYMESVVLPRFAAEFPA